MAKGPTTMPAGVPSPAAGTGAPGPSSMPAAPPPGAMGGFPVPSPMGPMMEDPSGGMGGPKPMQEYDAEPQSDGTVLLRVRNPDGSPGPVVKIITLGGKAKPAGPGA